MGRSEEELKKIREFSSFTKNPPTRDPRTQKQMDAYRKKERNRARWLNDYRQWERYRETLGNAVPKTFQTFQRHKAAGDEKYAQWRKDYRFARKTERFSAVIGLRTSTGVEITGVSKHVIERAVSRNFSAEGVADALRNPVKVGIIKTDSEGRVSQQFIGTRAAVSINPETGNVITGWKK